MTDLSPFLSSIKESFRRVKIDVNALWFANENTQKRCDEFKSRIRDLENAMVVLKGSRPKAARLVASKLSSKVHEDRCVFARNIEKENIVVFPSVQEALSKGMKKCPCLA